MLMLLKGIKGYAKYKYTLLKVFAPDNKKWKNESILHIYVPKSPTLVYLKICKFAKLLGKGVNLY